MPPFFGLGNFTTLPHSPSGNTSAAATQYYHWLYANYFASIPGEKTSILWSGPFYIFFFLLVMAISLWVYARMANAHRKEGELYGVESFGGVILERIGVVEVFTYVISIMLFLWAVYFFITMSIYGQVY